MLLCLAVQAEENFSGTADVAQEELEALWTNVKVILAGLQAYGQMWDGIDMMACKLTSIIPGMPLITLLGPYASLCILAEVKAALDAATNLPIELARSVSQSGSQSHT